MDFHCIEVLLGLPECRVIHQVLGPQQLALHLERRDHHIVCPQCGTSCSRVKESRPRCLRDLPSLEYPVMLWLHRRRFECPDCRHRPWETSETFGERTKWTPRLYHQVRAEFLRGCPQRPGPSLWPLRTHGVSLDLERSRWPPAQAWPSHWDR